MRKIVIVPFASRLHGESYYSEVIRVFKEKIKATGLHNAEFSKVITSLDEIDELLSQYSGHIPLFFPLTGGTEKLMYTLATKNQFARVVLFAHGEHNSLASAMSAKYRLESEGVNTYLFHCRSLESDECIPELARLARVLAALSSILGSRILLVGPYAEKPEEARLFEEIFESTVDVLSIEEFLKTMDHVKEEYIRRFHEVFDSMKTVLPREQLDSVARIYGAMRSLVEERKYDGLAMNCFPYLIRHGIAPCLALALLNAEGTVSACEGDLVALSLMILSKSLTGYTGWIANATAFQGSYAYFSHCTIALNMIRNHEIVTHFESGYPYAITGELLENIYTLVSLSRDYEVVIATIGRVERSGLMNDKMCRTQAIIDVGFNAEEIPRVAVANHHVLVPGDLRKELRAIATLLGLEYWDYREIVR